MAYLTLNSANLEHNYRTLDHLFRSKDIGWAVVSKLLCGNELYLRELLRLGPAQLCDSRISHLKAIKKISPQTETIYIKPPPLRSVAAVVRYADISFNTEYRTLERLSDEALKQGCRHRVVIMLELGERREGVMHSHIISFYERARELPGIKIIGVGTNFTCLSGVLPSRVKLQQLVQSRELLAELSGDHFPWASGGSSVVIPLLLDGELPPQINHFRVGETLFFGTDVYHTKPLPGLSQRVFMLYAQIIELIKKPLTPDGELGANLEGHTHEFDAGDYGRSSWRAIVDVGLLDVEYSHLTPTDDSLECIGASSDMLVVNLGANTKGYTSGGYIEFELDYMGVLRLMNSRYIEKRVSDSRVPEA